MKNFLQKMFDNKTNNLIEQLNAAQTQTEQEMIMADHAMSGKFGTPTLTLKTEVDGIITYKVIQIDTICKLFNLEKGDFDKITTNYCYDEYHHFRFSFIETADIDLNNLSDKEAEKLSKSGVIPFLHENRINQIIFV